MDGMLLLRLNDCATSTKLGMVDKGFPRLMKQLEAKGYVSRVANGYKATQAGFALLREPGIVERLKTL